MNRFSAYVLVLLSMLSSPTLAAANALKIPDSEYNALVSLYRNTNGPGWKNHTNWMTAKTPWYGVTIGGGHVVEIQIQSNNLTGALTAQIDKLTELRRLELDGNKLSGQIPASIGKLNKLDVLSLTENKLSGQIPSSIGDMSAVRILVMDRNQLSGQIPASIGRLTNLEGLILAENKLSGQIPASVGNLANLNTLSLMKNQLSGQIPESVCNLTKLEYLYLGWNKLSGNIPSAIGNLANLKMFDLRDNQLSGQIPESIGNMTGLQRLWLDGNKLSGEIPTSFTALTNLDSNWTGLSYNALSASDPGLIAFLDAKSNGWEETQTVPPTNLKYTGNTPGFISLSFDPIKYTRDGGYYEVGVSQKPGGPYTFLTENRSTSKRSSGLEVRLPSVDGKSYLVVRTVTKANRNNHSDVTSALSVESTVD